MCKMSEEDEITQLHRNKTTVFTLEERKLLLKLVNKHFDVLNNKRVDSASTQLKNQAWEAIHKQYLENTGLVKLPRTPQQLKRCWENMKCKARKGDPISVKLLRWSEAQLKFQVGYMKKENNEKKEFISESSKDNSDVELSYENSSPDAEVKLESYQNSTHQSVNNHFMKTAEALESNECIHCACEKIEKNAKVQLLNLKKQQNEELHQLNLQLTREKIKHEKELYKLYVHEMTLKIENERRRAEILDRELGNCDNSCAV